MVILCWRFVASWRERRRDSAARTLLRGSPAVRAAQAGRSAARVGAAMSSTALEGNSASIPRLTRSSFGAICRQLDLHHPATRTRPHLWPERSPTVCASQRRAPSWPSMACASCPRECPYPSRCGWPASLPRRSACLQRPSMPASRASTAWLRRLIRLGPSYIKLGQFLATRPDVIGPELARDLSQLQDNLPPFSMARSAPRRRAGARRQARGPFRRVLPRGRRRLHRAGAQGGRHRREGAPRGRGQDLAARRREALPPRSRQLLFRRAPDRALSSAVAAPEPGRRRRYAEAHHRHRDGPAAGSRRHLGDGREHCR